MNSNFHRLVLILLVVSIITASPSSARKMSSGKGKVGQEHNIKQESDFKIASEDFFGKVMGAEECGKGDEECMMRRAVWEAHLDYIYTQKRVP